MVYNAADLVAIREIDRGSNPGVSTSGVDPQGHKVTFRSYVDIWSASRINADYQPASIGTKQPVSAQTDFQPVSCRSNHGAKPPGNGRFPYVLRPGTGRLLAVSFPDRKLREAPWLHAQSYQIAALVTSLQRLPVVLYQSRKKMPSRS
jgi:hypothetical protein